MKVYLRCLTASATPARTCRRWPSPEEHKAERSPEEHVFLIGFRRARWQRRGMLVKSARGSKIWWHGVVVRYAAAWALSVGGFGAVAACAPPQPFVWASRLGTTDEQQGVYRIGPGDELYVLVTDQAALSGAFTVGPEGSYIQPVVGSVSLNGMTTKEASQQLTARLAGILVRPQVTVSVTKRRPLRVSVMGEVQRPGRFELPYDESILSALANAGGLTEFADDESIYVVRRDPQLLRIRFRIRDLSGPEPVSARFRLHDNDVLVVE